MPPVGSAIPPWTADVEGVLARGSSVVVVGPRGSGKTHLHERVLPGRGWTVLAFAPDGPLKLGEWLRRASSPSFDFGSRTVVVVDDVDALVPAERAVACAFARAPHATGRPVVLIGAAPIAGAKLPVVAAARFASPDAAAAALAEHPLLAAVPRAALVACCRRAMEGGSGGVDLTRAFARAMAEATAAGLGARVASRTDPVGCADAVELLASADALDRDALERRVGADPTTAYALVFENLDPLLDRVYCAGRRRAAVRAALVRELADLDRLAATRSELGDALVAALLAHLAPLPRRARCAPAAAPFARAVLWSRGAAAAQAASRRAERAAELREPAAVVRAREMTD